MSRARAARGVAAAVLLVVAALTGCAGKFQATRPYPAPDPAAILKELRRRQAAVQSADLETRTTSWLGGQRTRANVYMLVDRIGRLRFEAEVALQGTVATLVTDGKTFSLADFQSHAAKRGPACPENVASLIPVPLHPAEIAAVLLGDAPLAAEARVVGVSWDGNAGADAVEIENPRAAGAGAGGGGGGGGSAATVTRRLWLSVKPAPGALGGWDVVGLEGETPDGRGRFRVAFDDLADAGGFRHPGTIRFAEPGRSFDDGVEIKVKSRKLNPELRATAFVAEPPVGFSVEVVACGARGLGAPGAARPGGP